MGPRCPDSSPAGKPQGATGAEQKKELPTRNAAERELAKLVKQKLAKGYTDAAKVLELAPCGLVLREVVDPPSIEPEDASGAVDLVDMAEGSVADASWHGDYAFGSASSIDRGGIDGARSSRRSRGARRRTARRT